MNISKNVKISLNLPAELVAKIDSYADTMNINRTAAICVLISTQFKQEEAMNTIKAAVKQLEK